MPMQQFTVIGDIEQATLLRFLRDPHIGAGGLRVLVHSPGGDLSVCCALIDALSCLSRTKGVETVAMGEVESCAPLLVASGTPGKRFAFPTCFWGMHEPYLLGMGESVTVESTRQLQATVDRFYNVLCRLTNKTLRFWRRRLAGNQMFLFSSREAVKLGLVDVILT